MSELAPIFTPPWRSEDEFDAEKAWRLIENLRSDKQRLLERIAQLESAMESRLTPRRTANQTTIRTEGSSA